MHNFLFWGGGGEGGRGEGEGGRKKVHYRLGSKGEFHNFATSNFISLKGKVKIEPH